MLNISKKLALTSTQQYLDKHFNNQLLKGVLVAQWGNYGVVPANSTFATHAIIVEHYANGGYYPVGGSQQIAASIQQCLNEEHSYIMLQNKVTEIIIKDNKAIGVRATNRERKKQESTWYAPIIISNVGVRNTFLKLISKKNHIPFKEPLEKLPQGLSAIILYLGLKESPGKLRLEGQNYWIYTNNNYNTLHDSTDSLLEQGPTVCYISFPSLKGKRSRKHPKLLAI